MSAEDAQIQNSSPGALNRPFHAPQMNAFSSHKTLLLHLCCPSMGNAITLHPVVRKLGVPVSQKCPALGNRQVWAEKSGLVLSSSSFHVLVLSTLLRAKDRQVCAAASWEAGSSRT